MTEVTNQSAAAAESAPVVKTVVDDMNERRTFDSPQEAIDYLVTCSTLYADFNSYPIVAPGIGQDEDGNITLDETIYTADMRIAVATVEQRVAAGTTVVKAIMIYPAPTLQ